MAKDELWESLVTVCGATASEMTKSERGRYNRALKELREVGATAADIRARAGRWKLKYPQLALTPSALVAQWSVLKGSPTPRPVSPSVDSTSAEPEISEPEVPLSERRENLHRLAEMTREALASVPPNE